MKDPAEMTTAEYSALASSGKLPKPVPAVPTPEVLIDPATGQPYSGPTGPTPIPG